MFSPDNKQQLEASFKEFCKRPENQAAVEKAQRHEMRQALKLKEATAWLEFEAKIGAASAKAQEALAPFLGLKVLRRIIMTFGNTTGDASEDTAGGMDLEGWACNPRVGELLSGAKALLDSGEMSEKQLEYHLISQLKAPTSQAKAEFEAASSRSVVLPPELLVSALNEHLEERRKGNELYKADRAREAVVAYSRALAIVNYARGGTADDQAEVVRNKVVVLISLAAALIAVSDFGAACSRCTQALQLDPGNASALLRRAKALAMRREFEAAEADLAAAEQLHGGVGTAAHEGEELRERMRTMAVQDRRSDRDLYGKMFRSK